MNKNTRAAECPAVTKCRGSREASAFARHESIIIRINLGGTLNLGERTRRTGITRGLPPISLNVLIRDDCRCRLALVRSSFASGGVLSPKSMAQDGANREFAIAGIRRTERNDGRGAGGSRSGARSGGEFTEYHILPGVATRHAHVSAFTHTRAPNVGSLITIISG